MINKDVNKVLNSDIDLFRSSKSDGNLLFAKNVIPFYLYFFIFFHLPPHTDIISLSKHTIM